LPAKSVAACLGFAALALLARPTHAKAPLPTVLLYPASPADVAATVDLRTRLRLDGQVQVLTYDPESAAVRRAASDFAHPEWLTGTFSNDGVRYSLARALGAAFYIVVGPGRQPDSTHLELVDTTPAALAFDWYGTNRQFGARALESQIQAALAHPAAGPVESIAAEPVPPTPLPPSVVVPPVQTATAPPLVAAPPAAIVPPLVVMPPVQIAAAPEPAAPPVVTPPASVIVVPPAPVVAVPPVQIATVPKPVPVVAAPPAVVVPSSEAASPVPVAAPPVQVAVPKPAPIAPLPVVPPVPIVAVPPVAAVPPVVVAPPVPVAVVPEALPVPAAPLPLLTTGRPETVVPAQLPNPIITPERVAARPVPPTVSLPLPKPSAVPTTPAPPTVAALPPLPLKLPEQVAPRPVPAAPPTQMARVFPPALPTPQVAPAIELPAEPIPAKPIPDDAAPIAAAPIPVLKLPSAKAPDLAPIRSLLAQGDAAMDGGDFVSAISFYRQAINGVPLSVVPRLKLAQAYQKSGLNDKALDEAKRAVEISPEDDSLQKFLAQMDQDSGNSDGSLARARALVDRDPANAGAHSDLAEASWNSGDLRGAETEYQSAKKLSPAGDHTADAHLAQLYAAQGRYDDSLAALKSAGGAGYLLALKIVRSRSETLSGTIDASRSAFAKGTRTREQFYDTAKKTSADAQALADFVTQLKPLPAYKLSHLHRVLSANLLAQEAATLVSMIETGSAVTEATVADLDKSAMTEMLTARAAEEKLGLWAHPVQDGKR